MTTSAIHGLGFNIWNNVGKRNFLCYWDFVFFFYCKFFSNLLTLYQTTKFLDWFKLKAFADDKINVTEKWKFVLGRAQNILPAFSPFPTMFSKGLWYRVVKSQDCVVKSQRSRSACKEYAVLAYVYSVLLKCIIWIIVYQTFWRTFFVLVS